MSPVIHESVTSDVLEMTALYSAGAMDQERAAEFEQHLSSGCAICNAEVRAYQETAALMALTLPQRKPRPQLREMLMSRVAKETPAAAPSRVTVRAEEGKWRTWAPGILVKRLFIDKLTGAITQLVKVEPGAIYPAHRHGGLEQIYVIDGDVHFNDHELNDGDFEASMETSHHSSVTTNEGCLLLIINNVRDEMME